MKKILTQIGKSLSSYALTILLLFLLMIIIVAGTIDQKYIGLYNAQQKYFSSIFFFFTPWNIPFPGAYALFSLLFLNLSSAFLLRFRWKLKSVGNLICHTGLLLLLIGAFLSYYSSEEGYLALYEGETGSEFISFHRYELAVSRDDPTERGYWRTTAYAEERLKGALPKGSLPFSLRVKAYYRNAKRDGIAKIASLPVKSKREDNHPGCIIEISPKKEIHLFFDIPRTVRYQDKNYTFTLRKKRQFMPFRLRLLKFSKKTYPGTDRAKGYESRVEVAEQSIRQARIYMNHPFRYRHFTIYQSSYEYVPSRGKYRSIFSVVKNPLQIYPYLSCALIALGMVLHFILRLASFLRKRTS